MTAAGQVLEVVAPVFLMAFAGWIWARKGLPYDIEFVTRMAMSFATPCLIFSVLTSVDIDPAAFERLALATLVVYGLIAAGAMLFVLVFGLDRRTYLAPLTFGNTGNVGLPLCLFAFGDIGLAYAIVVFAVMAAMAFTVGVWMVTGGSSWKAVATQPIFLGAALGILWAAMKWPIPDFLANTLALAGQMAIPLMLVTLGVAVAKLDVKGVGQAAALSAFKLVLCALVAIAVSRVLGVTGTARNVLVLQALTPVAVTAYLLAERYQTDSKAVAALVVVSTVVAVGVMPLALAFLM